MYSRYRWNCLNEGTFGACEYASPCTESTTRIRTDRVCAEGMAVDVDITDPCLRDTDGVILTRGSGLPYGGPCDEAATQGEQTSMRRRCAVDAVDGPL